MALFFPILCIGTGSVPKSEVKTLCWNYTGIKSCKNVHKIRGQMYFLTHATGQ